MRKLIIASITSLCLTLAAAGSASAQTSLVAGNVWQVNEQGVYIQNSNGVTFVPGYEASFYVNGAPADYRYLWVGQPVNAYSNRVIRQGTVGNNNSYYGGQSYDQRNNRNKHYQRKNKHRNQSRRSRYR